MDTSIEQQPVGHFHIRSQASWLAIGDNVQQYETIPPGGIHQVYERLINNHM